MIDKRENLEWAACKAAFAVDGSLRDIYVHSTTVDDWDRFLRAISEKPLTYTVDGAACPLPAKASTALERVNAHLLTIKHGPLHLNCHFFAEEEIELDLDPREVTSQAAFDAVLGFMREIGTALGKRVVLTEESAADHVWLSYDPSKDVTVFMPE